ncbi:MAG: Tad domain-containing protein, partial [Candidatus Riflebacteria bacterium]|nr:Tad domain-containing protein [Candidatus Riflebacteria bacterium]
MTNKPSLSHNKRRCGNITLLTAAISVILMGIVALVTDVGSMYYDHAKLQTATNAAWKAGFDKLSEIRKTKNRLTEEDEVTIKNHMREVMAANGYANLTDEQLRILFTQNQTNLQINANDETQLFFMKIFNIQKASIAASREGGSESYSIMPIAVPHGEVHDLSVRTYDYVAFEGDQGFASGTEYILKLGGDENADPLGKSKYMIYIPTGLQGSQKSDAKTLLAYGAVFWALQIDETDKEAMVPAYWLLNNTGGGFLM